MGCCTSSSKYKLRKSSLDRKKSKEEIMEEEQKDQEKFHRPSTDGTIIIPDKNSTTPKKEPDLKNNENAQELITESSRRMSEYNLHRTLETSVKKTPQKDSLSPPPDNKERINTEESTVKISKEQHDLLLKFVDERVNILHNNVIRLFENLTVNYKEDEKLPMLMEEIKFAMRDIENSMDDLKSHMFYNSEELINSLERSSEVVRKIYFEYNMLRKNLKNYKEARDLIIDILKQHDPSIADTRTTDYTSNNGTRGPSHQGNNIEEKESGIFIPRDETNCSDLAHEKENLFDFGFESRPATGGGDGTVLPRLSNISSRRNSHQLESLQSIGERKESAVIVYRNLTQVYEPIETAYDEIVKSVASLERQLIEMKMKKSKDSITFPVLQEKFRYESENVRKRIEPCKGDLDTLVNQTKRAFEAHEFEENSISLRNLLMSMRRRKDELEEIENKLVKLNEELFNEEKISLNSPVLKSIESVNWNKPNSPKVDFNKVFSDDEDNPRLSQLVPMDLSNYKTPSKFPFNENEGDDVDLYEMDGNSPIPNQVASVGVTMTASKGYNNARLGFFDSTLKKSQAENSGISKSGFAKSDYRTN